MRTGLDALRVKRFGPASFYSVSEKRRRRLIWGRMMATVAIAALIVSACAPSRADYVASGPGVPFPTAGSFLPAAVREFDSIVAGAKGKPLVVNLWASWCGPCRVEAPLLARAARRYADVRFLGVDSKDGAGPAKAFIRRYEMSYPNLFDPDGAIADALGLRGYPTTYVFDRRGKLIASVVGGISDRALSAALASARQ